MALPGAQILRFDEYGIEEVSYEDTEAWQTISLFVNDRERLLQRLLADE
jgi:predicted ATPase